ncbi:MAG: hypothetical protein V3V55_06545, partial [Rhodospirillales bacterium]
SNYRQPAVEPASIERMAFPLPDKPSIAVLPFNNMSDDPSQEYFADGMTEDLITDLSKVSGLFVIARNSSFTYKGKSVEVRQVRSSANGGRGDPYGSQAPLPRRWWPQLRLRQSGGSPGCRPSSRPRSNAWPSECGGDKLVHGSGGNFRAAGGVKLYHL